MKPHFVVLEDFFNKKLLIQVSNICSIEEDDNEKDCCLVTYKINEQLHRCVRLRGAFENIAIRLSS